MLRHGGLVTPEQREVHVVRALAVRGTPITLAQKICVRASDNAVKTALALPEMTSAAPPRLRPW
eukprot:9082076-Lingulodinium_polyedra.AAC.1